MKLMGINTLVEIEVRNGLYWWNGWECWNIEWCQSVSTLNKEVLNSKQVIISRDMSEIEGTMLAIDNDTHALFCRQDGELFRERFQMCWWTPIMEYVNMKWFPYKYRTARYECTRNSLQCSQWLLMRITFLWQWKVRCGDLVSYFQLFESLLWKYIGSENGEHCVEEYRTLQQNSRSVVV